MIVDETVAIKVSQSRKEYPVAEAQMDDFTERRRLSGPGSHGRPFSNVSPGSFGVMQPYVRLREERRTSRRTIADALEVVRQESGLDDIGRAHVKIHLLRLASGQCPALVDVVFSDLGCGVSLPTSSKFKARGTNARQQKLEISRLDCAEICPDGSVLLADGTWWRAVEVVPTLLPYEPSKLDEKILGHVISQTKADYCYRSIREGVPEHLREMVPDIRVLDFSRVRMIKAPQLKMIRGYISDHERELRVSNQKIANALAMFGIRVPRRRRPAIPATF
jgi:hypothetical protein